jgi:4-diphosphocytidyl-2-C-methyl-D-erythritol kinase
MHSYSLIAPAKINLYLEIIGDRPDGYHELAMILQSIELADRVDLRSNGTQMIRVHCDDPQVPIDQSNLAYKAAALMAEQFPESYSRYGGIEISIQKRIPMGAGLAGGSTDAAAVLVGVNLMWSLGLTQSELQGLGSRLGSDVPFCIVGGTAIATGRGEQLSPMRSLDNLYAVLAKYRDLPVSTVWAYQTYRKQFQKTYAPINNLVDRRQRVHSGAIVAAVAQQDGKEVGRLLHNDLEKVVLPAHPQVAELRDRLGQLGTLGVMMSGSGSTVFALVESQGKAEQVRQELRELLPDPNLGIWTTRLTNSGIQVVS